MIKNGWKKTALSFTFLTAFFLSEAAFGGGGSLVGKDKIVLPGFSSISVDGFTIGLGAGRKYLWDHSYFPQTMLINNKAYVQNSLLLTLDDKVYSLEPSSLAIDGASDHDVTIISKGQVVGLNIKVKSYIEYDGLIQADISVSADKPVRVSGLHFEANIAANDWTRSQIFDAETMHRRKKKAYTGHTEYQGSFVPVIGVSDGAKSYWWFTDSVEGWPLSKKPQTSLIKSGQQLILRQPLINVPTVINRELKFSINLLVGPVKNVVGNVRAHRVARSINKREARLGSIYYWWLTAFAHQALPYLHYPAGVKEQIPEQDRQAYPGIIKNKHELKKAKKYGIDRIPYFSAHVLNRLDPIYKQNKNNWDALPLRQTKIVDKPFTAKRKDTFLTHRAKSYSDHLLQQFEKAIDNLGIEGIYFDQGGVFNTNNPNNGGWYKDGKAQYATEILAYREFHKRLATLFYIKGKKGVIISHNSNTMVLPAYTFVTAMLQGEEFIHYLEDYSYIKSIDVDEVRTRLGSSANGVASIWLSELWKSDKRLDLSTKPKQMTQQEWLASTYYEKAFKELMALGLLHDMSLQTFAPFHLREDIYQAIDWVSPDDSIFSGYWTRPRLSQQEVFWSQYVNEDKRRLLVVVSNLGNNDVYFPVDGLNVAESMGADCSYKLLSKNKKSLLVPAKDFVLLQIYCDTEK